MSGSPSLLSRSLLRRWLKPAAMLALAASAFALSTSARAANVACYPAWNSATSYVGGNQVSLNNENYLANYSSSNSSPATNSGQVGSGAPWIPAFPCNIDSGTIPPAATVGVTNTLMGYWENWGTIQIQNMDPQYKVLFYCFGVGSGTDGASIFMWQPSTTNPLTSAASDIAAAKAKGVKVILSIGGATSPDITLKTTADVNTFVSSVESLVTTYGFDGIDLDLENTAVTVNPGDSVTNPQTPDLINMINALRQIHNHFGSNFLISMVPQTAYVDAITSWGGYWGNHLPIIEANRDIVNIITVQDYNSGNMVGADGASYGEATADFEVAMAELLIHGFTISGGQHFTGVNPNQVSIGVEVNVDSAAVTGQAWNYLAHGTSYGGAYHLLGGPYSNAGGVTIWDANLDAANGYAFAAMAKAAGMNGGSSTGSTTGATCSASPSAPTGLAASGTTTTTTNLAWNAVTAPANCTISGYIVYKAGVSIGTATGTTFAVTGLSPSTTYSFTVAAVDSFGTGSQTSAVSVTTGVASCSASPTAPTGLVASGTTTTTTNLSWTAVTPPANCSISSYTIFKNGVSMGTSTSTNFNITGLTAGTTYSFTVAATDSVGTSGQSSAVSVTTTSSGGGIQIACGNSAVGTFVADTDFSGGAVSSGTTTAINTSKVINPAPAAVYQHGRKSTCTYTIPGLTAGSSYTVRLDFCEYAATAAGQRTFNVSINGTQVLTNFDIFAAAGGEFIANAQSFTATANTSGQIVIAFTTVVNNVLVAGIEVTPGGATCSANPAAPTGLAASSTSSTATSLSWTAVTPPSGCSISGYTVYKNGTSIGTATGTTFSVTGLTASTTYSFTVAATDANGTGSQSAALSVTTTAAGCSVAPVAPTGLAASGTTSTSTNLSWGAVTPPANCGISGYKVFQNGTLITVVSSGTTFAVTGLSPSTTYSFTVGAFDAFGTGPSSAALNVTTSAATGCTGIAAWNPNSVAYAVGNLVTYNGKEYKCITAHTSQSSWDPADAVSLWTAIATC